MDRLLAWAKRTYGEAPTDWPTELEGILLDCGACLGCAGAGYTFEPITDETGRHVRCSAECHDCGGRGFA